MIILTKDYKKLMKNLDVANYIGYQKTIAGKYITIMELVKLCYIAYGRYLAMYDRLLFEDPIKAWSIGAVPLNIYKKFRPHGIILKNKIFNNTHSALSFQEKDIINDTIKDYENVDPFILSQLTHKEGTPWTETVKKENLYSIIPDELIKEYYKKLMKNKVDIYLLTIRLLTINISFLGIIQ